MSDNIHESDIAFQTLKAKRDDLETDLKAQLLDFRTAIDSMKGPVDSAERQISVIGIQSFHNKQTLNDATNAVDELKQNYDEHVIAAADLFPTPDLGEFSSFSDSIEPISGSIERVTVLQNETVYNLPSVTAVDSFMEFSKKQTGVFLYKRKTMDVEVISFAIHYKQTPISKDRIDIFETTERQMNCKVLIDFRGNPTNPPFFIQYERDGEVIDLKKKLGPLFVVWVETSNRALEQSGQISASVPIVGIRIIAVSPMKLAFRKTIGSVEVVDADAFNTQIHSIDAYASIEYKKLSKNAKTNYVSELFSDPSTFSISDRVLPTFFKTIDSLPNGIFEYSDVPTGLLTLNFLQEETTISGRMFSELDASNVLPAKEVVLNHSDLIGLGLDPSCIIAVHVDCYTDDIYFGTYGGFHVIGRNGENYQFSIESDVNTVPNIFLYKNDVYFLSMNHIIGGTGGIPRTGTAFVSLFKYSKTTKTVTKIKSGQIGVYNNDHPSLEYDIRGLCRENFFAPILLLPNINDGFGIDWTGPTVTPGNAPSNALYSSYPGASYNSVFLRNRFMPYSGTYAIVYYSSYTSGWEIDLDSPGGLKNTIGYPVRSWTYLSDGSILTTDTSDLKTMRSADGYTVGTGSYSDNPAVLPNDQEYYVSAAGFSFSYELSSFGASYGKRSFAGFDSESSIYVFDRTTKPWDAEIVRRGDKLALYKVTSKRESFTPVASLTSNLVKKLFENEFAPSNLPYPTSSVWSSLVIGFEGILRVRLYDDKLGNPRSEILTVDEYEEYVFVGTFYPSSTVTKFIGHVSHNFLLSPRNAVAIDLPQTDTYQTKKQILSLNDTVGFSNGVGGKKRSWEGLRVVTAGDQLFLETIIGTKTSLWIKQISFKKQVVDSYASLSQSDLGTVVIDGTKEEFS